jgi:signal transduction histidine kinase
VTHILRGGRHLLQLINEVLDIARIESGRLSLSLEPVALAEAISEAAALIAPLADQRGIAVDTQCTDLVVLADRQRLTQVLLNLLGNAVKIQSRAWSGERERPPGRAGPRAH